MTYHTVRSRFCRSCAAAFSPTRLLLVTAGLASVASAQTVSDSQATKLAAQDQAVVLTPFEVSSDSDKSYGALNSNSITAFKTELDRVPVTADIFDKAFMADTGATSVEGLITGYSAGAGNALASPGTSASANQPGDRNANSFLSLRGLTAPTMTRDGFMPVNTFIQSGGTATGFTSNFDIERVEVINGPQSLLYGVGGAGGVINLVSKQARFGSAPSLLMQYQIDQYGHKLGLFDYGMGNDRVAVRVAVTEQQLGGRRVNVGGPMNGEYVQLAASFGKTIIRVSAEETIANIVSGVSQTLTAASTANDARNGQKLRYLLATNQINSAANGGASGAGVIDNGKLTWDNIDSYSAWWNTEEYTKNDWATLQAETKWNSWLTSQFSVSYRNVYDDRVGNTMSFDAPNVAANPTGGWAEGMTGAMPASELVQPVRQKGIRFSVVANNALFDGKVTSQTVAGADFVRTDGALITFDDVVADSSGNPLTTNTARSNGYTYLPASVFWSVANGPVEYPLWAPRTTQHFTYLGVPYVRVQTQIVNPTAIGPGNPEGLQAGGASALGDYRIGKTLNKGVYIANYSNWLDGKVDTLLGARVGNSFSVQQTEAASPSPPSTSAQLNTNAVSFNAGADVALLSWLRAYASVSDAYDPPMIFVAGPTGQYPEASKGVGEEAGFKFTNAAKTVSGSIAFYHANSKNEEYSLTSTLLYDINPSGLNGFYGAPSVWINVDRETEGVQLTMTANPLPGWRSRLSAATTNGTIGTTTSFKQLYNDQFYENTAGQVTYADGTVVYVPATYSSKTPTVTSTTAGAVALTVAMMSDPSNSYYANPLAVSGQINSGSNAAKVLKVVDPVHGAILTGATGLPISALQINPGFTPTGTIVATQQGQSTTGYPGYGVNFTNDYTFGSGWIRGLSVGGTVSLAWKFRDYYFYPNGPSNPNAAQQLFYFPTQVLFNGIVGYTRKFHRVTWSTQLNVSNMFNHYHVVLLPNYVQGWSGVDDATFDAQPRAYTWSTTLQF